MQKRKKQLLGAAGLAAVIAMTAVACTLPADNAAAMDKTITVTVTGGGPGGGGPGGGGASVEILGGLDGTEVTGKSMMLKGASTGVSSVSALMKYTSGKVAKEVKLAENMPVSSTGAYEVPVNLETYNIDFDSDVTFEVTGARTSGGYVSDVVVMKYRAVIVTLQDKVLNTAGEPKVNVRFSERVDKLEFMLYNPQAAARATYGKAMFVSKDGVEEPVIATHSMLNYQTLSYDLYLPMEKYGIGPGKYDLVTIAYDAEGNVISINKDELYWGISPDVPNTGSLFADLNISRMDYLLTGLIAFGAVAGFAIYLVARRRER